MRGFWAATLAFLLAFIGWFAFAPLMTVVRKDIGLCDNDADVQLDVENVKCICKKGCKQTLANAKIASVSFDVFTRFMMGAVIERIGPVNSDCLLLLWGAMIVTVSTSITNGTGLIIVRFFVSMLGSTFVVNQFWNSILFNKSVVGLANATAAGWGNLGGGVTNMTMGYIFLAMYAAVDADNADDRKDRAWRMCYLVPLGMHVFGGLWVLTGRDLPDGNIKDLELSGAKQKSKSSIVLRTGLSNVNAWILTVTYGMRACM